MAVEPLAIGVCSWSLQVKSVAELSGLLGRLGIDVVQIACGDPHHAAWDEGDGLPAAAKKAGAASHASMISPPVCSPRECRSTDGSRTTAGTIRCSNQFAVGDPRRN